MPKSRVCLPKRARGWSVFCTGKKNDECRAITRFVNIGTSWRLAIFALRLKRCWIGTRRMSRSSDDLERGRGSVYAPGWRGRRVCMMPSFPIEELSWRQSPQPTSDELRLSGGLQVEDWPHARQVERLATDLFSATWPLHLLNEDARRLLARAAFLHNAGMLVEARRHHKHSYRLIKETRLPNFTDAERHEIACIARYHRRALPSTEHEEYAQLSKGARKRVSALAALVRIADALDFS